jgi:hypothetical protein
VSFDSGMDQVSKLNHPRPFARAAMQYDFMLKHTITLDAPRCLVAMSIAFYCMGGGLEPLNAAEIPRVHDHVEISRSRVPGAPAPSDVLLSSRWPRPRNAEDPHDTSVAIRQFHPTMMAWMYLDDSGGENVSASTKLVKGLKDAGLLVQGTINTTIHLSLQKAHLYGKRDIDGWLIPWRFDRIHFCPNAPGSRTHMLERALNLADLGCDSIQVDDWDFWAFCRVQLPNETEPRTEKCYCKHCVRGFQEFLKGQSPEVLRAAGVSDPATFDYPAHLRELKRPPNQLELPVEKLYEEFGIESLKSFWSNFQESLQSGAGRPVALSANNYAGIWQPIEGNFAFGMSEMPQKAATPERVYEQLRESADLKRGQVFTVLSTNVGHTRRFIATTAASGGNVIVPWDVYMGSRPRLFGRPEDYADLYAFIRATRQYLDGYEDAMVVYHKLDDKRYPDRLPVRLPEGSDVFAVGRVHAQDPGRPVAVHLVDWSADPQAFTLELDVARFTTGKELALELLIPAKYDTAEHARAHETGYYQKLATRVKVPSRMENGKLKVDLPPLTPWGLLLISEPGGGSSLRAAATSPAAKGSR